MTIDSSWVKLAKAGCPHAFSPRNPHPLGTVFTFKLRAEPSCAECGLPVVTEMHVRTAKEVAGAADHAQPWGSWRQASPTREGYVYTHYPKENGIYRFEAKAVDGG